MLMLERYSEWGAHVRNFELGEIKVRLFNLGVEG